MTMTHDEKLAFLKELGFDPPNENAPAQQDTPASERQTASKRPKKEATMKQTVPLEQAHLPANVPVDSITLPAHVKQLDLTDNEVRSAAQAELFKQYRAPKGTDGSVRNKAVWRHLGIILAAEARKQRTATATPQPTRAIKADRDLMDIATVLKDRGITAADLIALLDTEEK